MSPLLNVSLQFTEPDAIASFTVSFHLLNSHFACAQNTNAKQKIKKKNIQQWHVTLLLFVIDLIQDGFYAFVRFFLSSYC